MMQQNQIGHTNTCPKCKRDEWIPGPMFINGQPSNASTQKICRECRNKMTSTNVLIIYYPEDDFTEVHGHCEICQQFPCSHFGDLITKMSSHKEPTKP